EGDFGVGVARDVEDSGRQLFVPFGCGLNDRGDADFVQALPGVREENDRDFLGSAAAAAVSRTWGFLPFQKHRPPMAAAALVKKTRRRTLVEPSRSRSELNIALSYFPV